MSILEAMACGLPVIAEKNSAIPEVIGDSGMLFANLTSDNLCRAIIEIAKNPSLSKLLSEKALKRSKKFSWLTTAGETIKVYEKAAGWN